MSCGTCDCPFQVIRREDGPFSPTEIQCMLDGAAQQIEFANDEILFLQGQPSTCLYAVTEGMVKICTHSPDGREQIVGLSTPDRLLVGLQSIGDERYAYTAIAASRVTACKVNHRTLLGKVERHSDLAMRLIAAVNTQLAHSRALMEVLGHRCAAAKIASFILLMTPKTEHGNCNFRLPFSRQEIASLLGLSEETVCRLMATMKRAGAIYAPRGRIEIRNWDQLQAIADGAMSSQMVH
jgi:CRP/FNR family transcriptional regulator